MQSYRLKTDWQKWNPNPSRKNQNTTSKVTELPPFLTWIFSWDRLRDRGNDAIKIWYNKNIGELWSDKQHRDL